MGTHIDDHVQVAAGAAVDACITLTGHPEGLTVVDARRHIHVDGLCHPYPACALALAAGIADDLALAAAVGTGLGLGDHAEGGALIDLHRAPAVAVRTYLRRGTGCRTGTGTVCTAFHPLDLHLCTHALARLHKVNIQPHVHILALSWGIGTGAAGATEYAAKEILEDISHVGKAALHAAHATHTAHAAVAGIHTGVTELVIFLTLLRVGKHLVCLGDLLELFLAFLIARMQIGVVLSCHGAVRFFDRFLVSVLLHAEHFIIISFFSHNSGHAFPSGNAYLLSRKYMMPRRSC